jgi:Leucine-rich repeat (LRR) protein
MKPTLRSTRLISFIAAAVLVLPNGQAETTNRSFQPFLKIARDKNATDAQKLMVSEMLKFSGEPDLESAHKKLKGLDTMVFYGGEYSLSDLSPLAEFTQLETLVLYNHQIENLTPLAALTNLRTLRLEVNRIKDLSPLARLENLESLQISDNQISDLRPLAGLDKLGTLWLARNEVVDVTALEELPALRDLDLTANRVRNLKPLIRLPLCTLRLTGNGIVDLLDLQNMNQQTTCFIALELGDNQIVDVAPIGKLERVTSINLSNNAISDISPLENPQLAYLDLQNNKLTDTSHLAKLERLSSVDVTGNPIHDFSDLLELKRRNPKLEITGGEPFEDAYRKSIPPKKQLLNSPLLGSWRSDVQESEWGPVAVELRFEANGICYQIIQSGDPDQEGGFSVDGMFSVEGKTLKMTVRGSASESEFDVIENVLKLTQDGQVTELRKLHSSKEPPVGEP